MILYRELSTYIFVYFYFFFHFLAHSLILVKKAGKGKKKKATLLLHDWGKNIGFIGEGSRGRLVYAARYSARRGELWLVHSSRLEVALARPARRAARAVARARTAAA